MFILGLHMVLYTMTWFISNKIICLKIGKHILPSITLETHVTAKQSSVYQKWIEESHPKAVSKPPIHNLIYI